ncbi:MAG: VWA domain-containing protein [Planctomycetota bacterium]
MNSEQNELTPDQLIEQLESESSINSNDDAIHDALRLSQWVREASDVEPFKPDPGTRTAIIQKLEQASPVPASKPVAASRRKWWIAGAISAMTMLALGIWAADKLPFSATTPVADLTPVSEKLNTVIPKSDTDDGSIAATEKLDDLDVSNRGRISESTNDLQKRDAENISKSLTIAQTESKLKSSDADKAETSNRKNSSSELFGNPSTPFSSSSGSRSLDSSSSSPASIKNEEKPAVVMRHETRTRVVPVTKTRTESRTYKMPDGSVATKQIQVPYTENVTQNYTVQVPIQTESQSGRNIVSGVDGYGARGGRGRDGGGVTPGQQPTADFYFEGQKLARNGKSNYALELGQYNGDGEAILSPRPIGLNFGVLSEESLSKLSSENHDSPGDRWGDYRYHRVDPTKSNEQYERIRENRFLKVSGVNAISTFSVDVDTASYANLRRFIRSNQRPPVAAIRIEELINYFDYDYPQPKDGRPFSVNMELAKCPWNQRHKLLRVGLQGEDIARDERPPTNLVLLIDVSGSMRDANKLPLLKQGFEMMVSKLNENDSVSIVTYAGNAGVVLDCTSGDQTKKILDAIGKLNANGSTHGSDGIKLAYELAQKNFINDGVNKVMLATDGDLNVGVTKDDELVELIKEKASEGVFLTVLGFGTGNLKDAKMEKLADNGNGVYAYIDSVRESHKVLVEQMSASLVTIAKDVKLQIEFNPAEVVAYRLIGYENRALATEEFHDDTIDAGEIGAGHSVTAIYELATTDQIDATVAAKPQGLKYQQSEPQQEPAIEEPDDGLTKAAKSGELLTLSLRYKEPDANESELMEFVVNNDEKSFESASDDFRFAASVAAFGMIARKSKYSGKTTLKMIQEIVGKSIGDDRSGYRAEFLELVNKYKSCGW